MSVLRTGPAGFVATVVDLRARGPGEGAQRVRRAYEDRYGAEPEARGGWYRPDDWARISYVASRLRPGGRVLDVGVGAGQFVNVLATSRRFTSVTGVDHLLFGKYFEMSDGIGRCDADIASLPFDDDAFDVATCMEVLEHVDAETFAAGVAELRRVCAGQLVMTVPLCEPEPISATHVRRFVETDALELFPDAWYTILDRPKRPWLLIEERLDATVPAADELLGPRPTIAVATSARVRRDTRRLRSRVVGLARRVRRRASGVARALGLRRRSG